MRLRSTGAARGLAWFAVVVLASVTLAGCSSAHAGRSSSSAADPAVDLLARIQARGTLVLPTDPAYPPASFAVKGAERAPGTKCTPDQLTANQISGYDAGVGKAVAAALGVEPCFVTPTWNELLAGHWGGRWDIAFASIGITRSRMDALYFTSPYYATPESFYVRDGGPYRSVPQLSGQRIGVCAGCFADLYLQKKLEIPGEQVPYLVDRAKIVRYEFEPVGLRDVGRGTLAAFLCQETAGGQAIADGVPLHMLAPPAYVAYIGGALDRASPLAQQPFADRLDAILAQLQTDGTLARLSTRFFGKDYATIAGRFDMAAAEQPPLSR
jgi:polar amino acid transport system substrate-binding protein